MTNIPPMNEPVSKRLPFFCGLGGSGATVGIGTADEDGTIVDVIIGDGEMNVEFIINDVIFIMMDEDVALIKMVDDMFMDDDIFMDVELVVTL